MKFPAMRVDLRIALLYGLFGGLWILFSDRFLFDHITDTSTLTTVQTYKGWLFVVCSALLIYMLLRRHLILERVAERSLHESEERYRSLLQNSLDAILLTAPEGSILSANHAACAMFGMSEEMICSLGRNGIVDLTDPRLAVLLEERRRTGLVKGELTMVRNGGEKFPAEISSSVFIDSMGNSRTSMIIRDVSERKRAEETLRQSERRFHSTLDNMLEGCQILGHDWQYLYINDAAAVHNRRPKEELLGRQFMDMWPGIEKTEVFAIIRRCLEERVAHHVEIEFVFPSGDAGWFEMSIQPVPEGIFILSMDITERKQAEEALRRSAANQLGLIESSDDQMWSVDAQYRLIVGNAAFRRHTEQVLGRALKPGESVLQEAIPLELRDEWARYFNRALAGERFSAEVSMGLAQPTHYREICFNPINDAEGRAIGVAVSSRDITERKNAEAAIRTSHEQLRALSGYLQQVREEERTTIAREIHDELGQQLTALKMDLAWVHKRLRAADVLAEKTTSILAHVDTAIHTVRKIATELRPGVLDDLGLVAALEWQAKEFQHRSGITCTLTSDVEEVVLSTQGSTAIFRIFQESLTNVARHSGATRVTARLRQTDDTLTMEISDNGKGIGIPATSGQRTFGLLGMQERAILLGGTLEFLETAGGGTTVLVRIPLQSQLRGT